MRDIIRAKELLAKNAYTCVLVSGENVLTSNERGVKPLAVWYERLENLKGFSAADKVVGRGAAFLYALLQVKAVYADVISEGALDVLERYGIEAEYKTKVPNIINRKGTGICPFEEAVFGISDKNEAYKTILAKMNELGISH